MKKISIMLFSLLFADMCYADCSTKNTNAIYNIPTLLIDDFPFDSADQLYPINQQILNGCDKVENIYLYSYFVGDQTSISQTSPFHLVNFEILNPGVTDAETLEKARSFIKSNFSFIFSFKNNGSSGNIANILTSNTGYNIVPYTTNDPSNTILNNGILYSMGNNGTVGGKSDGLQMRDLDFLFGTLITPTSDVLLALSNATLSFRLGTYHLSYFHISEPNNIYTLDSNIELRIPLQFNMPTCKVDVPSTLNLGTTTPTLLNQNSQNNHSFNVNVQCSMTMINNNFKLTILDANNTSNKNTNGILTNSSISDLKSNAVIQLINNMTGAPFQIGTEFDYFKTTADSGSTFTHQASAQLLKSAADTTTGIVEGRATFFINYD